MVDDSDDTSLKYATSTFLLNSLWYGLPQSRERVYICGVRIDDDVLGVPPQTFLQRVQEFLRLFYLPAPPAETCLTESSDKYNIVSHICLSHLKFIQIL